MNLVLIVGLGSPGTGREYIRHNIGWLLIEELSKRWSIQLNYSNKEKVWLGNTKVSGSHILLCKPSISMNESGDVIKSLLQKHQITQNKVLVLTDEVNLEFGNAKLRLKGSSGGHKGIQSIIFSTESQDFARLKIGIGPNTLSKMK